MKKNWKKIRKNIPEFITIGPKRTFKVVWVDSVGKNKNGTEEWGETDFESKEIRIRKSLKDQDAVRTFFHETLHTFKIYKYMHLTENQVLKFDKKLEFFMDLFSVLEGKE